MVLQDVLKPGAGSTLCQQTDDFLPDQGLESAAGRRQHPTSADGRILVVDAGGQRQRNIQHAVTMAVGSVLGTSGGQLMNEHGSSAASLGNTFPIRLQK